MIHLYIPIYLLSFFITSLYKLHNLSLFKGEPTNFIRLSLPTKNVLNVLVAIPLFRSTKHFKLDNKDYSIQEAFGLPNLTALNRAKYKRYHTSKIYYLNPTYTNTNHTLAYYK